MIVSFKHKGLELLFTKNDSSKIKQDQVTRCTELLNLLHVAKDANDLSLPSLRLHPLKGKLIGFYSVRVSGNWRITFRFTGQDVEIVNLEDYH